MSLLFEWDASKARSNMTKHKIAFEEAATVFGDALSITIEIQTRNGEQRMVSIGTSTKGQLVKKGNSMNKVNDEMLSEYDFSGGIRGKYAAKYRAGTNVVVLDPEVAEAFPDSASVNEALRTLLRAIGTKKLSRRKIPNSALQRTR